MTKDLKASDYFRFWQRPWRPLEGYEDDVPSGNVFHIESKIPTSAWSNDPRKAWMALIDHLEFELGMAKQAAHEGVEFPVVSDIED